MAKDESGIPHNLRRVCRRLQRWRSSHTGHLPIPESLWAAAEDMGSRQRGIRVLSGPGGGLSGSVVSYLESRSNKDPTTWATRWVGTDDKIC
jgi:hypothetical protein